MNKIFSHSCCMECRKFRECEYISKIPIENETDAVCRCHIDKINRIGFWSSICKDFIAKPLTITEIIEKIK